MRTIVSTKGQIVLPAEIRREDDIRPGQEFEIERIDRGDDAVSYSRAAATSFALVSSHLPTHACSTRPSSLISNVVGVADSL